ncbi:BrnT family toxin [Brevundimonas sp.]|uniref:BrnT family toxin n=1 Tax=Brevundimonas sp. TaxID=1871086 RepID=UPI002ABB6A48|nr:BrnT family toxin [Brevundimonas sp.]MDZ4365379.1 BrnT family toxin [Brevundimonas sp.]
MEFEWDDDKAASNLAKHGVDFDVAVDVFFDRHAIVEEDVFAVGEWRYLTIGFAGGILIAVIFSEPAPGVARLISARKATKPERKRYEASL